MILADFLSIFGKDVSLIFQEVLIDKNIFKLVSQVFDRVSDFKNIPKN